MTRRSDTRALAAVVLAAGSLSGGIAAAAIAAGPTAHAAATPVSGRFAGHTSQGKSLSFRVSGGRVRGLTTRIRWRCGRTTKTYNTSLNNPLRIRSGRFGAGGSSSPVRIRGTFTGSRSAAGTIRVHYRLSRVTYCDSGTVRWSARA